MGIETKTLTQIEGTDWGKAPDQGSYIEKSCFELRHKPIGAMTVEDLRLLIGQGIGVQYLLPRALTVLADNPLAHGMHYPGDLLVSVLRLPRNFWRSAPTLVDQVERILKEADSAMRALDDIDQRYASEAIQEALPRFHESSRGLG